MSKYADAHINLEIPADEFNREDFLEQGFTVTFKPEKLHIMTSLDDKNELVFLAYCKEDNSLTIASDKDRYLYEFDPQFIIVDEMYVGRLRGQIGGYCIHELEDCATRQERLTFQEAVDELDDLEREKRDSHFW